jgi:hypothetical protein
MFDAAVFYLSILSGFGSGFWSDFLCWLLLPLLFLRRFAPLDDAVLLVDHGRIVGTTVTCSHRHYVARAGAAG